jgi:hypothetical protein
MPEHVGWGREFDEPIVLPDGRQLVRLHDAATYITTLPKKEAAEPEWQAANRGADARGEAKRPDDVRADWLHAGAEPRPRSRVQYFTEGSPLGAEKAQEGPMKSYLLIAIPGLILCAAAGVLLLQMALLVSPD